jgi:putative transport protein
VAERIGTGLGAGLSVGYGIAYPFGSVSVVLLVQFLPRLLRRNLRAEEQTWQEEQAAETPPLQVKQYRVTSPNCDGKLLREINPGRMTQANISRVRHAGQVLAATPDVALHLDDVVMAVGTEGELDKLGLVLGEETQVPMEAGTSVIAMEVFVTEAASAGKRLADLHVRERFGVVSTRLRRQGFELTPTGGMALEMGDSLSVVGERPAVEEFAHRVGGDRRRLDETALAPFLLGLLLGVAVGMIPIPLPNGLTVRLGAAGGAFVVSLVLGHFGRIGPLRLYMPPAARQVTRELGLMLFLAGAGTNAGGQLVAVLQQQGGRMLLGGAVVTLIAIGTGLVLTLLVYRMRLLAGLGALCASMTNPPALSATAAQAETDMPTLAYASVYPVALIWKIVLAQVLVEVLRAIL